MTYIQQIPGDWNITDPDWPVVAVPDYRTGLRYAFVAQDLAATVADGGAVAAWGTTPTSPEALVSPSPTAIKPTLTHEAVGGQAAVTFAGAEYFRAAGVAFGTELTLAAVVKRDSGTRHISTGTGAGPFQAIGSSPAGGFIASAGSPSTGWTEDPTDYTGDWAVVVATYSVDATTLRVNDGSRYSRTPGGNASTSALTIGGGASTPPTGFLTGSLAEIRVFDRALTALDERGLMADLMEKYSIGR